MWYFISFLVAKGLKALTVFGVTALVLLCIYTLVKLAISLESGISAKELLICLKKSFINILIVIFLIALIPNTKDALIIIGAGALLESGLIQKSVERIEKIIEEV